MLVSLVDMVVVTVEGIVVVTGEGMVVDILEGMVTSEGILIVTRGDTAEEGGSKSVFVSA